MTGKYFAIVILLLAAGGALADAGIGGLMGFEPLAQSVEAGSLPADAPLALPAGYRQRVISDEGDLDIYPGMPDWTDMNTLNESGAQAGRYLYRTHEVRPSRFGGKTNFMAAGGGALSVVDLETGKARVLLQRADWEALDGIVWTPWHTLLFAEETSSGNARPIADPAAPEAIDGLLYEIRLDADDPSRAAGVTVRPLLGSMSHEGIEVDRHGRVYVIDEHRYGSIYRFVPTRRGDLGSGQLYALQVDDRTSGNATGTARWVALDMQQVQISARVAATAAGASRYGRPEDLEIIGDTLFVALTGEARVLSISLDNSPVVREYVAAGRNAPLEAAGSSGFAKPDNLASGPGGNLWISEDNAPSDIWVATPDMDGDGYADRVALFGSLSTPGAEATGIYFAREPLTLFVNVQHSAGGNDKTLAVSRE